MPAAIIAEYVINVNPQMAIALATGNLSVPGFEPEQGARILARPYTESDLIVAVSKKNRRDSKAAAENSIDFLALSGFR